MQGYAVTLKADEAELTEIAMGLSRVGAGWLQVISDFDDVDEEVAMLRRIVEKSGRPMTTSILQRDHKPEEWRRVMRAIAEAARNGLFLTLYDSLHALRQDASWERLGEHGRCFKRQAVYAQDHKEIFQAIAERDSERAQSTMYAHLSDVQRSLFQHAFPDSPSRLPREELVNGR